MVVVGENQEITNRWHVSTGTMSNWWVTDGPQNFLSSITHWWYWPSITYVWLEQVKWLLCLPILLLNCISGGAKMCDWLSNLYYATGWPRTIQEELLITAHCFAFVFTRVSRHVSRGVRRILLGQTARVSRLSGSLPQEDAVIKVASSFGLVPQKSSMYLNLCTSIFSTI